MALLTTTKDLAAARAVKKASRILYVAGPGDVAGTYRHWLEGRDDPSQVAVTYSGQFYELCQSRGLSATVIGHHPRREWIDNGKFTIAHWPMRFNRWRGPFYHFGQYLYHSSVVLRALRDHSSIIFVSSQTHLSPYWLAVASGKKVVLVNHCTLWPKRRRIGLGGIVRLLDKQFFKRGSHRIMTVSEEISQQINELTGGFHSPIIEFLPMYRPETFADVPPANHDERPFRILFVGRVEENKGIFDVLKIVSKLKHRRDIVFDIVGDGGALPEFRRQTTMLKLEDVVSIHGQSERQKVRELFSRSHAAIIPTRKDFSEGFNKVIAEAVLSRRPFITSNVCPALPYVRAAGIEVPAEDIQAYADAIEQLADDREFYNEKCKSCEPLRDQFFDASRSWAAGVRSAITASLIEVSE